MDDIYKMLLHLESPVNIRLLNTRSSPQLSPLPYGTYGTSIGSLSLKTLKVIWNI
jgi:hypothetical protein